jgi:mannan endo-1,4-beta-mannosidase
MALQTAFVNTSGTRFVLGDSVFPVVGVNCYFLAYCSAASQQIVMDVARQIGANTLRCWAFLNVDQREPGSVAFQFLDNGSIAVDSGPDGLERLDSLITAAESNGLHLILPLVNYWKDLGGMPLYLKWLGIAGGVEEFYRSPLARSTYQTWAKTLLMRRNTRSGRLYCT